MSGLSTTAYWVVRPGVGALRRATVEAAPAPGHSLIRAAYTGVSPGTERLVGLGLVPDRCRADMACRSMGGDFGLPIKYGYSFVGFGVAGTLEAKRVFVMHPHQDVACVADSQVTELPEGVPSARATLVPNLETALNAVWDAEPVSGESPVVFGGGIVGLLVAFVLERFGHAPTLVELDEARRARAASCPWVVSACAPQRIDGSFELAFHATGTSSGLQGALDATGFEGRVIDLSWYGTRRVTLDLGSTFHSQRKRILASQVGHVARPMRASHDARSRMRLVLELLADDRLDTLLSEPVPFAEMPELMNRVYAGQGTAPSPLVSYEGSAR